MTTHPTATIELQRILRPRPAGRLNWSEFFGNDNPVELEVGPGKGLFLATAAAATPGRNFVGVEVAGKYAKVCAQRASKHGLLNVAVVCDDARRFLQDCVPTRSLAALHVYFPDPWWKTRHRKRRVFTHEFLDAAARALQPGAMLRIATDVEEYFGVMTRVVAGSLEFAPETGVEEAAGPETPLTNFERKYQAEGRPIFRARYRRV